LDVTMAGSDLLTTMLAYNHAANTRLLDLASSLDDAQLDTPIEGGYGSIRESFVHLVRVEWRWRTIVETHEPPAELIAVPQPATIAALSAFADQEAAAVSAWLDGRSEAELSTPVLIIWRGDTVHFTPWHALAQLCMHGVQHRSEIAIALTRLGLSPGDMDFIFFIDPE
jgi:uncharacterized damage-inducible protein DinB